MSYKSICTFLTGPDQARALLRSAQELAARFEAHLEVCCLGLDTTQSVGFYAGAPAMIYQDALDQARERIVTAGHLSPGRRDWAEGPGRR